MTNKASDARDPGLASQNSSGGQYNQRHVEAALQPPYSPDYVYTTAHTQAKATRQRAVASQELSSSLAGLSIDNNVADGQYKLRLDSLDTDSGAADSEFETDDVEANTYHRLPSYQRRTNPGINRTLLQGFSDAAGNVGNDAGDTRSTAASTSNASCRFTTRELRRRYTSSLGVPQPDQIAPVSSREPSVVSDAGNQLLLRRRKKLAIVPGARKASCTPQSPGPSCNSQGSPYELQKNIFAALLKTQNSHGVQQEFLPREKLCELINPASVESELTKVFGQLLTTVKIAQYAHQICDEVTISQGEKTKIQTFRKIFATLVLAGTVTSIIRFLAEDISDIDLPLLPMHPSRGNGLCRRDAEGNPDNIPLNCFQFPTLTKSIDQPEWSPSQLRSFQTYQWMFLAPFFSQGKHGDVIHYRLHDHHVLPYVSPDDLGDIQPEKQGGFGKVFMVRIHPDHHGFSDDTLPSQGFAIKQQLHVEHRDLFKNEIKALKIFSGDGRTHDHIVSLLATYEQFKKINLVFYRADGDLFAYWGLSKHPPQHSYQNIRWMCEQIEGLADGLSKLHRHPTFPKVVEDGALDLCRQLSDPAIRSTSQPASPRKVMFEDSSMEGLPGSSARSNVPGISYHAHPPITSHVRRNYEHKPDKQYGRHGDINPGNILWYKSNSGDLSALSGTLKIADFGQAELNSLKSRTKPRDVANTLTYRPPECDTWTPARKPLIRQTYDMWCLGCVLLEFVTWMLGGDELLEEFTSRRDSEDFFQRHVDTTDTFFQVKMNAATGHFEIMVKEAVTQFIDYLHQHPGCTEFFHGLLNLIQGDMLVVDSNERRTCEEVRKALRTMRNRCQWDTDHSHTRPKNVQNSKITDAYKSPDTDSPALSSTVAGAVGAKRLLKKNRKSNGLAESTEKRIPDPTLQSKLIGCLLKSNFHDPDQEYAPLGLVKCLITSDVVKKEISDYEKAIQSLNDDKKLLYDELDSDFKEELTTWIPENGYRTFATAIVSGFTSLDVIHFLSEFAGHFTDEDLPLDGTSDLLKTCPLEEAKVRMFCSQRWAFLAPVFSKTRYDYKLPESCIFPFDKDSSASRKGAFGAVSKVKVHPDHHEHIDVDYVAIKEIQLSKDNDVHATYNAWEEEARALRHIEKLNHNHITKCIAAIRRGDRRYFMFPWAEGGSLQDFWESIPHQDPNAGLILQTIQQLRWLADALDMLHNCDSGNSDRLAVPSMPNSTEDGKNIRHGDLKPENILRFFSRNAPTSSGAEPQLGTLKIADMGLAKQHIHATVNRTKNTSQRYGTVRYEAPEALNEKGGRSRLYDVWSMGCITLEFIIWLLYGNKALEEFHAQVGGPTKQACQYFEGKPPKVHHVVTNWISHIRQRDPELDCTRALGIRYLWIDSICIIQGKDGDFSDEAKNMEKVFSGAHCVLAASRATNQHDGFLGRRTSRRYITFKRPKEQPYYICEPIDHFSRDVIEGSLNQRGWVLQERALARRTIYFAENQTYFECGNGIRCETLASMHSAMADFIGDPRFPEKAMRKERRYKIQYYQDLYMLYSRLQFSRYEDRPFAIAGLEKRLLKGFDTKGGYGVFDDGDQYDRGLFHRSILWQRGAEKEFSNGLKIIDFPADRNIRVPSWSWMAYQGGIDYVEIPGGTADWAFDDIMEPWTRGFHTTTNSVPLNSIVAIPAIVRDFKVANRQQGEVDLRYDTERTAGSDGQHPQCVIVAKDKRGRTETLKRHYVLVVAPKRSVAGQGRKVYERIGAGYIMGKYIALDSGIKAEIQ
ncbi:hypothetical protein E8E12_009261 [Didymella heteroderae]|uniref:Protein kinase domain-containing protein n=1 Tax=Didymella heteroderae TaxID=1769908 RepID=A0A9P5C3C7_9PLEO|nr:hypothetical protein E8E12_009261 [Didymella heteroderae]